jgi:hypothetical protein
MKNVTISMDDKLLEQVRISAATEGKSVSRYVADVLAEKSNRQINQRAIIERFLNGPCWDISGPDGRLPTRDEIYER